jgi:monoamine oxidase
MPESDLLELALQSLSTVFTIDLFFLKDQITSARIVNWLADPFSLGAYSYATVFTPEAKKILNQPLEDTLFFAGEALYEGTEMGTVEAALASGTETARKVIHLLKHG